MVEKPYDQEFMAVAIRLAQHHVGQTGDNPSVGALIIQDKAGKLEIVGSGVTAKGGRPHAEPQALAMAGQKAKGATAYVTLEPCSHFGKTPPCVDALINAGISRVVVALIDPDARVAGNGIKRLKSAGITVDVGCMEQQAYETLSAYLCGKQQHRAEVTLKLAISSDNGIGLPGKGNVKITGEIAHLRSHMLRYEHQAIMVGIGTVLSDNPQLTCRLPGLENTSPVRIVIDSSLRIPLSSNWVNTANNVPLWIICRNHNDQRKANLLKEKGCELIEVDADAELSPFDVFHILEIIYSRHISSVLLEGGAQTAAAFLNANAVDRLALFRSPLILGQDFIKAPDMELYLAQYQRLHATYYGKDHFSEWRNKQSCLPE